MKKTLSLLLIYVFAIIASCSPAADESGFSINTSIGEDGIVEFIVSPTNADATYIVGLLNEDVLVEMGGPSSVTGYINALVASTEDLQTYTGVSVHPYEGLTKYTNWYLYVAQVHKGSLVGTPVLSDNVRIINPYTEYLSEIWGVPVAVSDNGLWVAGAANGNFSFLYDVVNGEGKTLEGGAFWDVTDLGVCYGQDIDAQKPVKYEDGEFSFVSLDNGAQGDAMAVTPDGSKVFGWYGSDFASFAPYVIDNGTFKELSREGSTGISYIDDKTGETMHCKIIAACVRNCAANGAAAGYGLDDGPCREQSVVWKADGTFKVIGEGRMMWNFDWNIAEYIFGGMETVISPDGRYAAASCEKYGANIGDEASFPFLYDIEADEIIMPSDEDIADMNGMGVVAVSNDGAIYLNAGATPCVWTREAGVISLQMYLEDIYGHFEPEMKGSILADVSADGRTFVLYSYAEEGTVTQIYCF